METEYTDTVVGTVAEVFGENNDGHLPDSLVVARVFRYRGPSSPAGCQWRIHKAHDKGQWVLGYYGDPRQAFAGSPA